MITYPQSYQLSFKQIRIKLFYPSSANYSFSRLMVKQRFRYHKGMVIWSVYRL